MDDQCQFGRCALCGGAPPPRHRPPSGTKRPGGRHGGQSYSGSGSASRVLGLGRSSGSLHRDGVCSLKGWRAVVRRCAGLALPVFALLLPAFDQVACG
eukprot:355657-Chlamydomonas_euryale.AAC.9